MKTWWQIKDVNPDWSVLTFTLRQSGGCQAEWWPASPSCGWGTSSLAPARPPDTSSPSSPTSSPSSPSSHLRAPSSLSSPSSEFRALDQSWQRWVWMPPPETGWREARLGKSWLRWNRLDLLPDTFFMSFGSWLAKTMHIYQFVVPYWHAKRQAGKRMLSGKMGQSGIMNQSLSHLDPWDFFITRVDNFDCPDSLLDWPSYVWKPNFGWKVFEIFSFLTLFAVLWWLIRCSQVFQFLFAGFNQICIKT